jgi:hypothetical protein
MLSDEDMELFLQTQENKKALTKGALYVVIVVGLI